MNRRKLISSKTAVIASALFPRNANAEIVGIDITRWRRRRIDPDSNQGVEKVEKAAIGCWRIYYGDTRMLIDQKGVREQLNEVIQSRSSAT